jgi:hypothetical protein
MWEKIGRLAEAAASNIGVSRRGFLGRLGQSALGVVGVLAGVAATGATARAHSGSYICCTWRCYAHKIKKCYPAPFTCGSNGPPFCGDYGPPTLISQKTVSDCSTCTAR